MAFVKKEMVLFNCDYMHRKPEKVTALVDEENGKPIAYYRDSAFLNSYSPGLLGYMLFDNEENARAYAEERIEIIKEYKTVVCRWLETVNRLNRAGMLEQTLGMKSLEEIIGPFSFYVDQWDECVDDKNQNVRLLERYDAFVRSNTIKMGDYYLRATDVISVKFDKDRATVTTKSSGDIECEDKDTVRFLRRIYGGEL